jgi:hypothetical protein
MWLVREVVCTTLVFALFFYFIVNFQGTFQITQCSFAFFLVVALACVFERQFRFFQVVILLLHFFFKKKMLLSSGASTESVERYLKRYPWYVQLHHLDGGKIPALFIKRNELMHALSRDEPHVIFTSWERNLRRSLKVVQTALRGDAWKVWVHPQHFCQVLRLPFPLVGHEPGTFNLDVSDEELTQNFL